MRGQSTRRNLQSPLHERIRQFASHEAETSPEAEGCILPRSGRPQLCSKAGSRSPNEDTEHQKCRACRRDYDTESTRHLEVAEDTPAAERNAASDRKTESHRSRTPQPPDV